MDSGNFQFFIWLGIASLAAALAAQSKELNGKRFRPWRFFGGAAFYATLGFSMGLLLSTQIANSVSVIGAVMAAVLLRVIEQFTSNIMGRMGVGKRDGQKK